MNFRQAVERSLSRQSSAVRTALSDPEAEPTPEFPVGTGKQPIPDPVPPAPPPSSIPSRPPTAKGLAAAGARAARQERFERVRQRHRDGVSRRQIPREFRMSFTTVQKYLHTEACPVWRSALKGVPVPSPLDPIHEQLRQKVIEGVSNAKALFRDLRSQG